MHEICSNHTIKKKTRKTCEICSKLAITTREQCAEFVQIQHQTSELCKS